MSDLPDQDNQLDEFEESPNSRPQASRSTPNRPFMISIGVIALIFVAGLIYLLYLLFARGPQQTNQTRDQAATISAQNALIAAKATSDQKQAVEQQLTQEAIAKFTATPVNTATPAPVLATPTSVLAIPTATGTPTATVSAQMATQTAAAAATKAGGNAGYPGPGTPGTPGTPGAGVTPGAGTPQPTPTGLPKTGFADEVGLPGLFGVAALLVVIIFVARRARQTQ